MKSQDEIKELIDSGDSEAACEAIRDCRKREDYFVFLVEMTQYAYKVFREKVPEGEFPLELTEEQQKARETVVSIGRLM